VTGARLLIVVLSCLVLMVESAWTADNAWSVPYFNSRKSEWDQLIGATISLEGRVSLAGGGQLRLMKFELPIHGPEAQIRTLQARRSVEVVGRLKRDNGKLIFDAVRIQTIPSDLEQFSSRTTRFRNATAAEWTEVADWARERSTFYEDDDLLKKAQAAYEQAVNAEWKTLAADDAEGRLKLARKAAGYQVSIARQQELKHEACRILWTSLSRQKESTAADWSSLAERLRKELSGSEERLATYPAELAAQYEREPLHVYFEAREEVRRQLHRIFYLTVLLQAIEREADADGRNGDAIAARLEAEVPELAARAEQYRDRKLKWRLDHAETATRPEIEQLVVDAQAVKKPEVARAALSRWFQAREPRLREDGAVGRLQLADEYLTLQKDERKAVQLLVEAHKLDPSFAEVLERLRLLGYAYVGGTWTRSAQPPAVTEEPHFQNPSALQVGMTASAARNAMGGNPANRARVLTKGKVTEIWTFGARGSTRLVLRLEGDRLATELKVVDIQNER